MCLILHRREQQSKEWNQQREQQIYAYHYDLSTQAHRNHNHNHARVPFTSYLIWFVFFIRTWFPLMLSVSIGVDSLNCNFFVLDSEWFLFVDGGGCWNRSRSTLTALSIDGIFFYEISSIVVIFSNTHTVRDPFPLTSFHIGTLNLSNDEARFNK